MFSGPLPERVNHKKLATEKRKLEGTIPLQRFERLVESLETHQGEVEAKLEFRKARKHATKVVGRAQAKVSLQCQNCLDTVDYDLKIKLRHTIVNSDEALFNLDEDEDGMVCVDDMIHTVDMLEDEFLLALPMVPRHPQGGCEAEEYQLEDEATAPTEAESETHRPFAGLADLKDEITGARNGRSEK